MQVFAKKSAPAFNHKVSEPGQNKDEVEKETEPKTTFRIAIQNQQQGIAYLILDSKFDYMLAM